MQWPTDSGQLVHLVDLDMLAAEGSPLDLEEVHVYLSDPRNLRGNSNSQTQPCSPFRTSLDLCNFQNDFTR